MTGSERPPVAFYSVSNSSYFLGAVAMVNSLRLVGHAEPVYILDCGLTGEQRELLAPHVELVPRSGDTLPYLLKTIAPRDHPAEVMVLIDADMIATRSLAELVGRTPVEGVMAFRNRFERFFPQWGEMLELGAVRHQPYLCSALICLAGSGGLELLRLMEESQTRVASEFTDADGNVDEAFVTLDQDVLNAILSTRVEPERMLALEHRLAPDPPFEGLRLVNERALRCSYDDGTEPFVLHHLGTRKPWLEPMHHDLYSQLMLRLLVREDVAVRVPEQWLPLRLRGGLAARAERVRVDVRDRLGSRLRGLVPKPIMRRVDALRLRRAAEGR